MADNTELLLAQGDLAAQTAVESKIDALQNKSQEKVQKLGGGVEDPYSLGKTPDMIAGDQIATNILNTPLNYRNAVLQSITDGDTFYIKGQDKPARLAGDPTVSGTMGWVDSKEVMHPGWVDPREDTVIPRQAAQMGLPSSLTFDQKKAAVFKQGEIDKLEALYTAIGRPKDENGKEWTPGPILYDPVTNPMILGGKGDLSLNIPVQIADGVGMSHNRNILYLRSADGKHNLSVDQARMGNVFVPRGNNKDIKLDVNKIVDALKNIESSGDYKAVNQGGYVGAYQFGASRLADMGLVKRGTKNNQLNDPSVWTGKDGASSLDKFLGNKELQDQTALRSVNDLARQTKGAAGSISDWYGKIMAAHLLGVEGSKKLSAKDGNGTSGQTYYDIGVKLAGTNGSNSYSAIEKAVQKAVEQSSWNPWNLSKALVGGFGRALVDTADTAVDIGVGVYNRVGTPTNVDFLSTEEKDKYQKELGLGMSAKAEHNNQLVRQYMDKALSKFSITDPSTYNKIDWGEAWKATKMGFNTPENAAHSAGYLGGFFLGGLEKLGVKVFGKVFTKITAEKLAIDSVHAINRKVAAKVIDEATAKTLKTELYKSVSPEMVGKLEKVDELSQKYLATTDKVARKSIIKEYKKATSALYKPTQAEAYMQALDDIAGRKSAGLLDKAGVKVAKKKAWEAMDWRGKVSSILATATPYTAYGAVTANQDLDGYYKKHGELATLQHVMTTTIIDSLTGMVDVAVFKDVLKGPGSVEKIAEAIMNHTKDAGTAKKVLGKILEQGVKYTAVMPEELVQEQMQNYMQAYNVKYGKLSLSGLADDKLFNEAMKQSILAPGSAIHMRAGGSIVNKIRSKRFNKDKSTSDGTQVNLDEINSAVEAVNKWDDPAGKVNAYIRAKRKGEEHGLTPVEEKQAADYIMAHILAADQQIKALNVLMESPDVSEKDKIEHAATIDELTKNRTRQWMAYVDVTNSDSTVLNNRPIEDIDKEIAEVDTKLQDTKDNGEKAKLDARMKVLAIEKHIAEQLQSPRFQKVAEKIDKSAAIDGINTQGKRTTVAETLANKLYSGASDESGQKRGMLEYARMVFNPNIPEEAKQSIVKDMEHFLSTQKKKAAAALAAKEDYEAHNDGNPVSKVYGKYQDGSDATFTYRSPKESEKFVQTLVAENDLLDSIYSKIMSNEGQINEQDKTTQTGTTESTPTEKGAEPIVKQNQQSSEVLGEAPTKTVGKGEQGTFDFGSGGVETKAPVKPKESGRELLNHPRLKELLDMRENILAKDATYAQILVNKRYIHNGDNGRLDTKVTPAGYEKNWAAQFSLTKKDVKAIRDGKVTDEIYSKLQNDLGVLDNSPEWALQDSAKLADKDKLLKAIDEVKMQVIQSEGVSQQQIDQRLSTLDKLMDKLYEDYMREDSATVKNQIDDAVKQLHDRVTPGIKVLQKLVDTQISVQEETKELKKSEQKLMRLKEKLVGTPKIIVEKLWDKLYAAKQAYENKYADVVLEDNTIKSKKEQTKEKAAITKQANDEIEQDMGIRPFSGGKTKGMPKATTKTTKARLMAIKSAGVSEETLYNDYSKKTDKIQNEIDSTEEQVAMKEANLADSKEQLDKLKAERKKANSKNTIGDIIITEYSRKTEEDNKLIMDALKNMDKTDQAIIKEILGCN